MTDLELATKPPLGGWAPHLRFSAGRADVLGAVADTLVPAGEGFPAPSEAGVVAFLGRYVTPSGQDPRWYPFVGEDDLVAHVDGLGSSFGNGSEAERVEALRTLERQEPEFFTRLRDLVYQAYYSRPEVVAAINRELPAGRDYRVSPQPFGYLDTIADWDEDLLARVEGDYLRTEDVVRVDLPATLAGPGEKAIRERSDD